MKIKILLFFLFFSFINLYTQESLFLETEDGWKIHAKYFKARKDFPTLILIHSQKSNYTEWKKWFNLIEKFGYGWIAVDLRGHGVSIEKVDGTTETYTSFSVSGFDNEYNKMIRDIDALVIYLSSTGVNENNIFIVGINLGANLAIKYAAINKNIGGCVVINPAMNINDVLTVNPLMQYGKRPILFVASQNNRKRLQEVMLLYDITQRRAGKNNTFILHEYSIKGADTLYNRTIFTILNWINYPIMGEIIAPSSINISTQSIVNSTDYMIIQTED